MMNLIQKRGKIVDKVKKINKKFKTREALLNWLKRGKVIKRIIILSNGEHNVYYRIINNELVTFNIDGWVNKPLCNRLDQLKHSQSGWFRNLDVYSKSTVKEAKGDTDDSA